MVNQHCWLRLEVLVRGEGENGLGELDDNYGLVRQNVFIFCLLGPLAPGTMWLQGQRYVLHT